MLLIYVQFVEIIEDTYLYVFFSLLLYISKKLLVENFHLRLDSKSFYTRSVTQFKLDSGPWGLGARVGDHPAEWASQGALERGDRPRCRVTSELRLSDSQDQRARNIAVSDIYVKCLAQSRCNRGPCVEMQHF